MFGIELVRKVESCMSKYNYKLYCKIFFVIVKFVHPGREHSPKSQEPNGKSDFGKLEVFTVQNRLQKHLSTYSSTGTTIFACDFQS